MESKITQLKQEQIVGDNVVFEDVHPKTVSEAVYDDGTPLNEVISRIWNSVNNKLSRVVNSVNGRTGVVVLNKTDIGLSDVDNVSYAEIKQWVVDQLSKISNHLQLVDRMEEIDELIASDDKQLNGAPFFSERGYNQDKNSYIGYIYWDDSTKQLLHKERKIRAITDTDMSIIYDEAFGSKDYSNGKIGVNIAPGEDVLKVLDTGDKVTSGLMIDKNKIGTQIIEIDGMYGDGTATDSSALLYFGTAPATAKEVEIYIDGNKVNFNNLKIRREGLTEGLLILCHFKDYRTFDSFDAPVIPNGMAPDFMGRTSALGRVRQVPSEIRQTYKYIIDFHTLRTNPGWGMQVMTDHRNSATPDQKLIPKVAVTNNADHINYSGLQIFAFDRTTDQNVDSPDTKIRSLYDSASLTIAPTGITAPSRSGIAVTTDYSLAISPVALYGNKTYDVEEYSKYTDSKGVEHYYGSYRIGNWAVPIPEGYHDIDQDYIYGASTNFAPLGVNLDKYIMFQGIGSGTDRDEEMRKYHGSQHLAINISGLRITKPSYHESSLVKDKYELTKRPKEWFGGHYGDDIFEPEFLDDTELRGATGGLSVNVGKYLEIAPGEVPDKSEEYYDGGKVNVRIGKGLEGEPVTYDDSNHQITGNRIQIKLDPNRNDLGFDDEGRLIIKNPISGGPNSILRFTDADSHSFDYNPTGADPSDENNIFHISLGPGLVISE